MEKKNLKWCRDGLIYDINYWHVLLILCSNLCAKLDICSVGYLFQLMVIGKLWSFMFFVPWNIWLLKHQSCELWDSILKLVYYFVISIYKVQLLYNLHLLIVYSLINCKSFMYNLLIKKRNKQCYVCREAECGFCCFVRNDLYYLLFFFNLNFTEQLFLKHYYT